jgi:hypothetical protein
MEKELPDEWDIVYFGGVMWREPFEWTKSFARLRMMSNTAHYAIKRSSLPKIISLVVNATVRASTFARALHAGMNMNAISNAV